MQEINLLLTIDEANVILDALGSQPFSKVYTLIGKIQQQASEQLGNNSPQVAPQTETPLSDE